MILMMIINIIKIMRIMWIKRMIKRMKMMIMKMMRTIRVSYNIFFNMTTRSIRGPLSDHVSTSILFESLKSPVFDSVDVN